MVLAIDLPQGLSLVSVAAQEGMEDYSQMTTAISQKTPFTKLEATLQAEIAADSEENPLDRAAQNAKAKSVSSQLATCTASRNALRAIKIID